MQLTHQHQQHNNVFYELTILLHHESLLPNKCFIGLTKTYLAFMPRNTLHVTSQETFLTSYQV